MSMKLLFNYRKKTIYLQVAKDHFINMQSAKREFVPRQDLVKLKPGKHTNYLQIVCNAKALEKMHERKINQFVVVDDANKVIGVISMHDLIQAGVN